MRMFATSAVVAEDTPGVRDLGGDLVAAETFNLNYTGDVFKQEHDLPRRVGETES